MDPNDAVLPSSLIGVLHRVELNRSKWWLEALGKIVLWRLAEVGRPQRYEQVKRSLVDDLGITVDPEQFSKVLDALKESGAVVIDDAGSYALSEQSRRMLWRQKQDMVELEKTISGLFAKRLANAGCVLSPGEVFADFQNFLLNPLIGQLGARTYSILTGLDREIEKTGLIYRLLERIEESQRLPVRDAITAFLDPDDPYVRQWVLGRLHARLLILAASLDRESLDAVAPQNGRKVRFSVLLDTNFLFSILELHANPSNEATFYLLDLIKEIGDRVEVRLLVLPQTISEATNAILVNQRSVDGGLITPALASAALRSGTQPGLVTHFLEAIEKGRRPMDAESYFRPYLNGLEILLAEKDIEVVDDATARVLEQRQSIQAEIGDIMSRENAKDRPRPRGSVVHDVVLWRYVEEKRKKTTIVADMEYWGLSIDFAGMLRYDRDRRRAKRQSPCFMHPSQFIQMLQFWVPRNDKLEGALLSSARLPFMFPDFDAATERVTLRIISELARYSDQKDISTEAALKILQNGALRDKIASDVNGPQVPEAIDQALLDVVGDLEKENEKRQAEIQRLAAENSALQRLAEQRGRVEEGRNSAKRQARQEKQRAEESAVKLRRQLQEEQRRNKDKDNKLLELEEQQKELGKRLEEAAAHSARRVFSFVAVIVAALCALAAALLWSPLVDTSAKGWPWKGALLILVATGIWAATCCGLAVRLSRKDASWWVYTWAKSLSFTLGAAFVGGVVGTIIQFAAAPPD